MGFLYFVHRQLSTDSKKETLLPLGRNNLWIIINKDDENKSSNIDKKIHGKIENKIKKY